MNNDIPAIIPVLRSFQMGSHFVCDPPVTSTDRDYVLLVKQNYDHSALFELGWQADGAYIADGDFQSYRLGDVNLILTKKPSFFYKYHLATQVCKYLNLHDKADRVMIYDAVARGHQEYPHPAWDLVPIKVYC